MFIIAHFINDVRSNVRKEDTDMVQVFTNLDTLVELTKNIPVSMEIS